MRKNFNAKLILSWSFAFSICPKLQFSTSIIHNSIKPPVLHTNIFSKQNMKVIMGIYHEGVFSSSPRYEAIPIHDSALPPESRFLTLLSKEILSVPALEQLAECLFLE